MRRFIQHFDSGVVIDNFMTRRYTLWKGVKCPSCGKLHPFEDLKILFDEECNKITILHCKGCGKISKLKYVKTKERFGDIYVEVKI